MLVDWFTVGAQVVNFLVLVWLMKRFLYKPILDAIDARERRIAAELAEAGRMKAEAGEEREAFERRREALEQRREEVLAVAREEAVNERRQLLTQAREEVEALRARQNEALKRERDCLLDEIARRTRAETFAIARKVLADLAGVGLDERASVILAERLRALDEKSRSELAADALVEPVLVRGAFELSPESRSILTAALDEITGARGDVRFEVNPDLVGGIEILTRNRAVAWSIEDYLVQMRAAMDEVFVGRAVGAAAGARGDA